MLKLCQALEKGFMSVVPFIGPLSCKPLSRTLVPLYPGGSGSCVQVRLSSVWPRALAADLSLLALEFLRCLALGPGSPLRHMHD